MTSSVVLRCSWIDCINASCACAVVSSFSSAALRRVAMRVSPATTCEPSTTARSSTTPETSGRTVTGKGSASTQPAACTVLALRAPSLPASTGSTGTRRTARGGKKTGSSTA